MYGVPVFSKTDPKIALMLDDLSETVVFAESVGQFTGEYDLDNKKIYEGDVLNINTKPTGSNDHNWKMYVVWSGCAFRVEECHTVGYRFTFNNDLHVWSHRRILGNIYSNPELLSK